MQRLRGVWKGSGVREREDSERHVSTLVNLRRGAFLQRGACQFSTQLQVIPLKISQDFPFQASTSFSSDHIFICCPTTNLQQTPNVSGREAVLKKPNGSYTSAGKWAPCFG
ncbi:uncharacterized protein LOC129292837 [Prosopis cineraria]|uniref:uncharacterized protein LOC129292837 n=1 Tax=Prosopis cineraria TaxID=364024 RepID=UPI00241052BD|nr:uncharacterized protein LOC129292837 [Prosopis cineraria]